MSSRCFVFMVLLVTAILLDARARARAQTLVEPQNFSVERFQLAMDGGGILTLESAQVPRHLTWSAALWFAVADDPLVLKPPENRPGQGELVGLRVGAGVVGSLAFFDWVQLGLEVPLVLHQTRPDTVEGIAGSTPSLRSAGVGAIRFTPKLQLFEQQRDGMNLAVVPALRLPALSEGGYVGDDDVRFEPEVLVSRDFGGVRAGLGAGYRFRPEDSFGGLDVGDELFAQVGIGVRLEELEPDLPLGLELVVAASTLADRAFREGTQSYVEVSGALLYTGIAGFTPFVAAGSGRGQTAGTPDWRMVLGFRVSPIEDDPDRDGVRDDDLCPTEAEDRDGFMDLDGCPDLDDDRDGILDAVDQAPRGAEDLDGFQDEDGAPDVDNDQDGVLDAQDRCPNVAGPTEALGCPLEDADQDGIPDVLDICRDQPAETGQTTDADGCPDANG